MNIIRILNVSAVGSVVSRFKGLHPPFRSPSDNGPPWLGLCCRSVMAGFVLMISTSGQTWAGDLSCSLYFQFTSSAPPGSDADTLLRGGLKYDGVLGTENTSRGPIHLKSDESKRTVKAAGSADQVLLGVLIQDPKVSFSEDKIVLEEILPVNHAPNVSVTAITIDRKTGWFEVKRVSYSTGRTTTGTDYRFGSCTAKGGHF